MIEQYNELRLIVILLDCVLFKECMRKSLCFGVFGIVKLYGGLVRIGCYL